VPGEFVLRRLRHLQECGHQVAVGGDIRLQLGEHEAFVFSQCEGALVACNFLTKPVSQCSQDLRALFGILNDWKDIDEMSQLAPEFERDKASTALTDLKTISALVQEGSAAAEREEESEKSWSWGIAVREGLHVERKHGLLQSDRILAHGSYL
jgi:hypothetical protein